MSLPFKKRFWRLCALGVTLFFALFIFRFIYGYVTTNESDGETYDNSFFTNLDGVRKNYASEKIQHKESGAVNNNAPSFSSSLMYEKTATVSAKSVSFEQDNAAVRSAIDTFSAVIQFEKALGQKGHRELHLLIGIKPESFDTFYKALQHIGSNRTIIVTKVDKTNEYQQLNAKKASLEKTLQSLEELKARQGDITAMVELQDKLLDIQERLQGLGVDLGNFDQENQFCTVQFSMYEGAPAKKITTIYRVKIALEWTIEHFTWLMFGVLCLLGAAFILLLLIDKFNLITRISKKMEE